MTSRGNTANAAAQSQSRHYCVCQQTDTDGVVAQQLPEALLFSVHDRQDNGGPYGPGLPRALCPHRPCGVIMTSLRFRFRSRGLTAGTVHPVGQRWIHGFVRRTGGGRIAGSLMRPCLVWDSEAEPQSCSSEGEIRRPSPFENGPM